MISQIEERLLRAIEGSRGEMVEMHRSLCAIPALGPENGGEGEVRKAEWLLQYMHDWPLQKCELLKARDSRVPSGYRPNIVAILPGKQRERTLWLMSHLDVVPAGDLKKWSGDPWVLRIDGDRLIGRGTEDNHQGIVSSLFAARTFIDLQIVPEINLGLLLVADEETGSRHGVQYLLENHRGLFRPEDLFLIPDAGNSDGSMLEIAEKSILWLRFEITGVQTHASTPEQGKNAHKAGAALICLLDSLHDSFAAKNPIFDPPISTFEPTKKEANVPNINTIPGEDVFYFDCRILPDYPLDAVWEKVRGCARAIEEKHGVSVRITSEQEERAAPPTPADAPVVRAIQQAVAALRGMTPEAIGIGGGTVAAFFRRAGFPAAVWSTIDDLAHEPDEYCLLSNVVADAKVFARIALAPGV